MTDRLVSACPDTPNCVSSFESDATRYVEPLRYRGNIEEAKKKLLDVIRGFSRARVREDNDRYMRVTFTSFLFRFKDDVEFQFDDGEKLIHMKSASRVGYYDFGVNRRRCETIRERFD